MLRQFRVTYTRSNTGSRAMDEGLEREIALRGRLLQLLCFAKVDLLKLSTVLSGGTVKVRYVNLLRWPRAGAGAAAWQMG